MDVFREGIRLRSFCLCILWTVYKTKIPCGLLFWNAYLGRTIKVDDKSCIAYENCRIDSLVFIYMRMKLSQRYRLQPKRREEKTENGMANCIWEHLFTVMLVPLVSLSVQNTVTNSCSTFFFLSLEMYVDFAHSSNKNENMSAPPPSKCKM